MMPHQTQLLIRSLSYCNLMIFNQGFNFLEYSEVQNTKNHNFNRQGDEHTPRWRR